MAKIELLLPTILQWEGHFVNDPIDMGGATNMGVTLSTWKQQGYDKDHDLDIDVQDLKLLEKKDVLQVLQNNYWNRWKADQINNQSIAELLVDFVWGSGKWGIIIPQRAMGLKDDGVVGPVTIAAINSADPKTLFELLYNKRIEFIMDIVKHNPEQSRFRNGWINRVNYYRDHAQFPVLS